MKDFCDGRRLLDVFNAGIRNLEKNSALIDSFDSYPISNYDTGSKLCISLRSSQKKAESLDSNNFSEILKVFSESLILETKGFFGVLFGNFFHLFIFSLGKKDRIYPSDFLENFQKAYGGLSNNLLSPKEDTVIKSLEVIDNSIKSLSSADISLKEILAAIFKDLNNFLETRLSDENSRIEGITIDAGTVSLFLFLEGIVTYLELKPLTSLNADFFSSFSPKETIYNDTFCISYTIKDVNDIDSLKRALNDTGNDSAISILEDNFVKIHIHSMDPKKVFDRTSRFGKPANIRISDSSVDGISKGSVVAKQ